MSETTPIEQSKRYKNVFEWLLYAIFVVPKTQVKIFDLPYQLYTFDVFHQHDANRWSHFIGIPLNLIALYCIFLPQNMLIALGILLIVFGHHCIMSIKYQLYALIPILVLCHVFFWLLAIYVFEPYVFCNEIWYLHPTFHFLFWPFIQYATHSLESFIPKPWSISGNWSKLIVILRESKWYVPIILTLMIPFHTFVELISSWRNLYIEILGLTHKLGYKTTRLQAITQWIKTELNSDNPTYEYQEFQARFVPYFKQYLAKENATQPPSHPN